MGANLHLKQFQLLPMLLAREPQFGNHRGVSPHSASALSPCSLSLISTHRPRSSAMTSTHALPHRPRAQRPPALALLLQDPITVRGPLTASTREAVGAIFLKQTGQPISTSRLPPAPHTANLIQPVAHLIRGNDSSLHVGLPAAPPDHLESILVLQPDKGPTKVQVTSLPPLLPAFPP